MARKKIKNAYTEKIISPKQKNKNWRVKRGQFTVLIKPGWNTLEFKWAKNAERIQILKQ